MHGSSPMTEIRLPATRLNAEQQREGKEGELVQDPGKGCQERKFVATKHDNYRRGVLHHSR